MESKLKSVKSGDVVTLDCDTTLEIPLERVLDGAKKDGLTSCLILGWDRNGEFRIASQDGDCWKMAQLLRLAEKAIYED